MDKKESFISERKKIALCFAILILLALFSAKSRRFFAAVASNQPARKAESKPMYGSLSRSRTVNDPNSLSADHVRMRSNSGVQRSSVFTQPLTSDECLGSVDQQILKGDFDLAVSSLEHQTVGSWFFSDRSEPREMPAFPTTASKFMYAIGKSGLLVGFETKKRDDDTALKLLREVALESPGNAAPLIFAGQIEKQRGSGSTAKALAAAAKKSVYYDDFSKSIYRAIYREVKSPADLIEAVALGSKIPIPKTSILKNFLVEYKLSDVATLMIRDAFDDLKVDGDLEWTALDYAVGRSALYAINPNRWYPEIGEVVSRKNSFRKESIEAWNALQSKCTLNALSSEAERIKRKYALTL